MVTVILHCPHCDSEALVRDGHAPNVLFDTIKVAHLPENGSWTHSVCRNCSDLG